MLIVEMKFFVVYIMWVIDILSVKQMLYGNVVIFTVILAKVFDKRY